MERLNRLFNEYRIASNNLYNAEKLAGKNCIDVKLLIDYNAKKEEWERAAKDYSPSKWS